MVEPRIYLELWEIIHLNIWTKINFKYYSQTCSNDHLCKATNAESAQANSHPIVTVQDNHLSNMTSEHFFDSQMKKNLSKTTTTKLYPAKECEKNIRNNA